MDLPGFFNKPDFFGKILPGYIAIILYLVLFKPNLFLDSDKQQTFNADIFTAAVFLVAGPALGFMLYLFHRYLYTIRNSLFVEKDKRQKHEEYVNDYYTVRISCSDSERLELDQTEAEYDFSVSTSIALLVIDIYYIISNFGIEHIEVKIGLILTGTILLLGIKLHNRESLTPLIDLLIDKYCKSKS